MSIVAAVGMFKEPLQSRRSISEKATNGDIANVEQFQSHQLCSHWSKTDSCFSIHHVFQSYYNQLSINQVELLLFKSKACLVSLCELKLSDLLMPDINKTLFDVGNLFTLFAKFNLPQREFPLKGLSKIDWKTLKEPQYLFYMVIKGNLMLPNGFEDILLNKNMSVKIFDAISEDLNVQREIHRRKFIICQEFDTMMKELQQENFGKLLEILHRYCGLTGPNQLLWDNRVNKIQ